METSDTEAELETSDTVWTPPPGLLSDESIASLDGSTEPVTEIYADTYAVPEPGIILLLGIGLAALKVARRKKG